MKINCKTIKFSILLSCLAGILPAQQINMSFYLNQDETGTTKQYLASDHVSLKSGFTYNSTSGKTFNAKIDKTIPLPTNSSNYKTSYGTITDNPAEGAIVGAVPGSAAVTPSGAATYQIPIEIPQGIAGMQPQVSIVYNSQGGFGALGTGWDIAGTSGISRGGKNMYFDGKNNTINFDNTDPLYLDGQRLIQLNNESYAHFAPGAKYGTEIENHICVEIKDNGSGNIYFLVTTKDGKTMEYGKSSDALVKNSNNPFDPCVMMWKLNKVSDLYNNYMTYYYTEYGQYLQRIDYTGNTYAPSKSVVFSYNENLSVPKKSFISSFRLQQNKVLSSICTYSGSTKIKDYRFGYVTSGVDKHLDNVSQYASDNSKINATKINWGSADEIQQIDVCYVTDQNLSDQSEKNASLSFADINADGYPDRIEMWVGNSDQQGHIFVYMFNKSNNSFNTSPTSIYFDYHDYQTYQPKVIASDINNDGKNEVIFTNWGALYVYKLVNGSFVSDTAYNTESTLVIYNKNDPYELISLDVNQDNYNDIVLIFHGCDVSGVKHTPKYLVYYGSSIGLRTTTNLAVVNYYSFSNVQSGDFNADGKIDVMGLTGNANDNSQSSGGEINYFSCGTWGQYLKDYKKLYTVDFNGDGLSDILGQSSGNNWVLMENAGSQSVIPTQKSTSIINASNVYSGERYDSYILDYNGDGLPDLILGDETFTGNDNYANTKWYFYANTGGNFALEKTITSSNRITQLKGCITDINGDGAPDLVLPIYNKRDPLVSAKFIAFTMPNASNRNLVVSITNGMGLTNSFRYKNYDNFTQAATIEPIRNLNAPLKVVEQYTDATGSITTYDYAGAKIHAEGKGFLGFSTVTSSNETKDVKVVTQYEINEIDQKYFNVSQKSQTVTNFTGNAAISSNSQTNTIKEIDPARKRFFPTVTAQTTTDALKDLTQSSTAVYDDFGNVTTQETIAGDGDDKVTTTVSNVFIERGNGTVKYLPQSITTTRKKSGETDYIRETDYVYNDNGNLIKETIDPADINKLITEYKDFDTWGHARTVEVSITGKPVRKSTVKYSTSGYYIESKTNHLLEKTSYTWDEALGLMQSQTDHWNRITSYAYDAWGQLLFTTYPDGVRKGNVMQWAASGVAGAQYYSYSETAGSSPVWVWYDILGHEIRKDYYGLNEKKICVSTEYTGKNQVYRVSDPYFVEDEAYKTWATTYSYDSYGRPLTVTTTRDISTSTYSTRTTNITSRKIGSGTQLSSSETTLNSAGQTKTSTVNDKTVTYSYYPSGLTKTSTPDGGQALTMDYNLQGKRKYLKDPDAGEVFSTYNGFGELTEEKQKVHNAQFIVTTNNYDDYGILTSIVRNLETTTYAHYDPNNKSRVSSISIPNKNTQYFSYDEYDRVYDIYETIGNDREYETYTEYDAYGRVATKQYPSGYVIINSYDKYGNLTEVKDSRNRSIWKAVAENARGQIMQERKGNLDTYYGFDDRGLPTGMSADYVADLEYSFNSKGNLVARYDYQNNQNEEFQYDNQNRLTNWNVNVSWGNSGSPKYNTMTYDANTGIINNKTDVGILKYGIQNKEAGIINPQPGPHALTSVDGPLANSQTQNLNVSYTDFKKIKTLDEESKHYELTYGVDDQRCKSDYTLMGYTKTRYYLDDYEEETDNAENIKQIHYLSGGAVMIINNGVETLYYGYTDFQGSLIALVDESGIVVEKYAYDPWGARRNPDDWTQKDSRTSWILNRGYTGHEHLDAFGIINMNGRVYDPTTAQFFSPDLYVQAPGDWLNYNRYGYCLGNPFKYTDPSGEFIWLIPIGALIGTYIGGVIANNGQNNPMKWDYNSGKTWGYMLGGAVVGGISSYAGWAIASSGIPMANTAAIAGSSLSNSVGTWAYTGGQTPITMSLGVASFDFTNGTFGYLGKEGNKWYENLGYAFGALANLQDGVTLFRGGGQNVKVNSAKTYGVDENGHPNDWWGHSSITDENGNSLVSVGPESQVQKAANLSETWQNSIKGADVKWETYLGAKGTWSVELNNVSTTAISKYASGITRWDLLLNSCVGHTTRALWSAGVPVLYLFHPQMLNLQLLIRQLGIYSSPYLYQIPK